MEANAQDRGLEWGLANHGHFLYLAVLEKDMFEMQ